MKTLSLWLVALLVSIPPAAAVTITGPTSPITLDPTGINAEVLLINLDNSLEPGLWVVITSILTDLLPPGVFSNDLGDVIPIQLAYSVAPNDVNNGLYATLLTATPLAFDGLYNLSLVVTYELYDQNPFDAFGDPSGALSIGGDAVFLPVDLEIVNATSAVPEPSGVLLFASGALLLIVVRTRRQLTTGTQ